MQSLDLLVSVTAMGQASPLFYATYGSAGGYVFDGIIWDAYHSFAVPSLGVKR